MNDGEFIFAAVLRGAGAWVGACFGWWGLARWRGLGPRGPLWCVRRWRRFHFGARLFSRAQSEALKLIESEIVLIITEGSSPLDNASEGAQFEKLGRVQNFRDGRVEFANPIFVKRAIRNFDNCVKVIPHPNAGVDFNAPFARASLELFVETLAMIRERIFSARFLRTNHDVNRPLTAEWAR